MLPQVSQSFHPHIHNLSLSFDLFPVSLHVFYLPAVLLPLVGAGVSIHTNMGIRICIHSILHSYRFVNILPQSVQTYQYKNETTSKIHDPRTMYAYIYTCLVGLLVNTVALRLYLHSICENCLFAQTSCPILVCEPNKYTM